MKTPKDQPPKYSSLTQSSKLNSNRKSFSFAKPNADWKSNSTLYGSSILYQSIDHQLPLKELVKYKRPVMYAVEIADVQCPPSLIKSGSVTSSITEDDSDEFKTFGQNEPIGSYLSSQNNFIKSLLNLNPPDIIQDSTQNIPIDRSRSKILSSQLSLSSLDKRRASLVVSDISERQKLNESELLDQLHINVDEKIFIQNMSLKSDLGSSALQRIFDRAAKHGKSHILMCLLENHKNHIDYSIVEELVIRAAVQNGNIKLLELILRDNSATTRAYVNENLRLACTLGLSVIVQMILDDGRADPSISHNDPLKIACRQGHVIICKMLIETEKCDPNDSHGNHSPLTLACEYGHVKIVEYLLGLKHIDPAILDQKPITLAVLKGRVQIMEHLLKNPFVDPSVENNKLIQIACQNGHDKIVQQLLLDSKVNPAVRDNTPLLNACQNNREKIVKILMNDDRINPGDQNNLAIIYACTNGNLNIYKMLISDSRVDPSAQNNECIKSACRNGHHDVLKVLMLDTRVDPSCENNYCLRKACVNGHEDILKTLLSSNVVDPTVNKNECLRNAKANGQMNIVKILTRDYRVQA